ncbi:MAG: glycosyltransferase family 4 protein [Negativicutes bacterium]|nr:glycosyltransferase family 4 protein [Negativicutes bacterium]
MQWENFLDAKEYGSLIKIGPATKMALLAHYVKGWHLTARRLLLSRVPRILLSTSLRLAWIDALFVSYLRHAGVNVAMLVHRPYYADAVGGWRRKPISVIFDKSTALVVLSKYVRQVILENFTVEKDKVKVVPVPYYRELLKARAEDSEIKSSLEQWRQGRPMVVYMSSILASHGITDFVNVVPELENRIGNVCFLIMGNDQLEGQSSLAKYARQSLAGKENVRFQIGFYTLEQAKAVLRQAAVLLLPYRSIPQSGVIPFAAGEGVPVVATRVGGLPEMIIEGRNGELAEAGNLAELAEKTAKVVSLSDEYREHTKAAAEVLFSPETYCAGLTSVASY